MSFSIQIHYKRVASGPSFRIPTGGLRGLLRLTVGATLLMNASADLGVCTGNTRLYARKEDVCTDFGVVTNTTTSLQDNISRLQYDYSELFQRVNNTDDALTNFTDDSKVELLPCMPTGEL